VKLLALIILLSMFVGCASSSPPAPQPVPVAYSIPAPEPQNIPSLSESLSLAGCGGSGDFRGVGIGRSDDEALNIARSDLAKQVNSSMKVSSKYHQSQQLHNGVENLSSNYESELVVEANLLNAQDARVLYIERRASETGAVVCMTKSDAAKSFIEKQRLLADSLELASNIALNTEHPKHKNEAWRRTQTLYNDFMKIQNMLKGWGFESPYSEDETYSKTKENYKNYCQEMKTFWQDTGNECSDATFSILSKKIKIEKSGCSGGLNLHFNCSEKCKSSAYGIECVYEPLLAIVSCGGESYSLLKVKMPIVGTDIHNEAKAREKVIEELSSAAFINEWEKEIKEWVPQCTD